MTKDAVAKIEHGFYNNIKGGLQKMQDKAITTELRKKLEKLTLKEIILFDCHVNSLLNQPSAPQPITAQNPDPQLLK